MTATGLGADAFREIYAEHMPALTRYCRAILRDGADAEDAAQNAMERALRALAGGPAPARMKPWLLTIARHEAITVLRGRRRAVPVALDERTLGGDAAAEELPAVRARLAELLADLQELSPRQREALVQRELGGRSYREIAAGLGVGERAAQQVVLEARTSLARFAEGRSLACDDVQAWLSANDHGRVRTRRVRAHLRDCRCCSSFQASIGARRRQLGLLLPGVGGGGVLGPFLAGLLGQGAAKLAGAGALALGGAALATSIPLAAEPPVPGAPVPSRTPAAHIAAGVRLDRVEAPNRARRPAARVRSPRHVAAAPAATKHAPEPPVPAAAAPPAVAASGSSPIPGTEAPPPRSPEPPAPGPPAEPSPAPAPAEDAPAPAPPPAVTDALAVAEQTVDEVTTAAGELTAPVRKAVDTVAGRLLAR